MMDWCIHRWRLADLIEQILWKKALPLPWLCFFPKHNGGLQGGGGGVIWDLNILVVPKLFDQKSGSFVSWAQHSSLKMSCCGLLCELAILKMWMKLLAPWKLNASDKNTLILFNFIMCSLLRINFLQLNTIEWSILSCLYNPTVTLHAFDSKTFCNIHK